MGFLCTTAGAGAGVDGVENAAETLPPVAKAGGGVNVFEGGGGSGIAVREGGVKGAPNDAPNAEAGFTSGARVGVRPPVGAGRSGATGCGSSL